MKQCAQLPWTRDKTSTSDHTIVDSAAVSKNGDRPHVKKFSASYASIRVAYHITSWWARVHVTTTSSFMILQSKILPNEVGELQIYKLIPQCLTQGVILMCLHASSFSHVIWPLITWHVWSLHQISVMLSFSYTMIWSLLK
jgi:hypothetical protein